MLIARAREMDHSSSCAFALVTSPRVDVRCVLILYTCLYCYGSVTTWRRWLMRGVRQQRRRRHFAVHRLRSTRYAARMPTRITAVIVYKGGVAKTTTVVNLAVAFVAHGQRVLIIDANPQGGIAPVLGIEDADGGVMLRDALLRGAPLEPSRAHGIDLAHGGAELAAAAVELPRSELPWHWALADALSRIEAYDEILIDTPPGLGALTMVALVAATCVVIPTTLDASSYRTLPEAISAIGLVRTHPARRSLNPALQLGGVLPTLVDLRSRLACDILERLRSRPELCLLEPPIPLRVAVRDAALDGRPVVNAAPSSPAATAYRAVAAQLLGGERG